MTTDPPNWAVDSGEDHCGLWADLALKDVVQRFRWIKPGEFLMGSPDDEAKRKPYEGPQHRVRISRGFWLADTACTQAFWRAVMDVDHPSLYVRDDNPVDFISWDDVQGFLERLQRLLTPDWMARLPTEAQWEYACRAGTCTPFSLGENVTARQVNFNSDFPYRKSEREPWRGRTVPVRSLPPNPWGLYEMHGNLWEWCQDLRRFYPDHPVVDPTTPVDGRENLDPEHQGCAIALSIWTEHRAMRGGSYSSEESMVRSASRFFGRRQDRSIFQGFRFLLTD